MPRCQQPRIVWPTILAALTFATSATACNRNVFTAYALVEILRHHECVELSVGTSITIEAADPSNLAICVLPAGEIDCWWMSPEMVDGLTPERLRDALK
jgi:hypothetical protein